MVNPIYRFVRRFINHVAPIQRATFAHSGGSGR